MSFSFVPTTVGGLPPGWYRNSGAGGQSSIIYEDKSLGLKIVWENSYVYEYPGKDPLYWYTEVKYLNTGSQDLTINCVGRTEPSLAKEHMQGTANAGWVPAEETFCSRNPNFTASLKPGETHYGVPAVLEQKTTICCKLLCLLTSKQRVSPAYSRERTHVEGGEENLFYELNPTLSVGNIRTLLPRSAWTKPFVFLPITDYEPVAKLFSHLPATV